MQAPAEPVLAAEEGRTWGSAALDVFGMAVDELTQFWQESGGGHAALALVQAQDELQAFAAAYVQCRDFRHVHRALQSGSAGEKAMYEKDYRLVQDVLLLCENGKERLCVPEEQRNFDLGLCHDELSGGAHAGFEKTLFNVTSRFYWPRMTSRVDAYCRSCDACQRNKSYNANRRGIPLHRQSLLVVFNWWRWIFSRVSLLTAVVTTPLWFGRIVSRGESGWSRVSNL